jgi:fibronectin type 3 domain-containing protein
MMRLRIEAVVAAFVCFACLTPAYGAINPDKASVKIGDNNSPSVALDIETLFETVCSVGAVSNYITNSTVTRAGGTNEWTILMGDDSAMLPSMKWVVPEMYADNHYLYFASLRIGTGDRLVHLSTESSPGGEVNEGPDAVSDFDTHFYISDQSPDVPPEDRINIRVHENTYAWAASEADDFIIYEFWIVNLNWTLLDAVYVALHADCDISAAGGGSGPQGFWRDDLVGYYRDDETGEYISYMYDADNPTIPGNDEGGIFDRKESLGYIGSRLLYCPPIVGENTPSVQQGHGWWDWNSDPGYDFEWMAYMSDGLWLDPPPSPHDFRILQKLGPFEIAGQDSIRVVLAFGIGNGLIGMRSNLNNAHLLFENEYVYYDLPPEPPQDFAAQILGTDIEFSWEPVDQDDLAGYSIYSATDPEGPFLAINAELIDTTYYLYSPPDRGFFYFFATAEDIGGNESWTTDTLIATTLPYPPSDFRAISGNNLVQLNWSTVEGADAYRIYRANNSGGPYSQIAELPHPDESYTDNEVINYQTYFYVASTLEGGYESPWTGEVEVTPNPDMTGRVLLVDDYQELDNWGNPLKYQEKRRFYQRWGVYNFDYDVWVITDQGMPDLPTLQNYQAVLFASDGEDGDMDDTWWFEVGSIGGGVLKDYLQSDGHLLAIGQLILLWVYNSNIPLPGDFEFDWFGIDSVGNENGWTWDYWDDFTWAIGAEPGYPDSMKIDVAKNGDQEEYATTLYSLRPGVDTLFLKGLNVNGSPPNDYLEPVGIIYRPDGVAVTSLINFSLYLMPNQEAQITISNILRDEFGCTFYEDPTPLPPWHVAVTSVVGEGLYLTWDAIDEDDVVAIRLYRSVDGSSYELLATFDSDAGEYTDGDVSPGIVYSYKLTCVDFAGQEGDFSQEVSEIGGRPPTPTGLAAESGDGEVTLSWTRPADPDIVSFKIYRRMGPFGDFVQIATVPVDDTSYYDTDIINRNIYHYYVTSYTQYDVESYPSDMVFAFPRVPGRDGILVVNGIDWETYGSWVVNLYQNRSFTGSFPYKFWDLFDTMPIDEFPDPDDVLGWGDFPPVFFDAFETIIWAGNNYMGDEVHWHNNQDNIMDFLNSGGNLILPVRLGSDWFFGDLADYCGIVPDSWVFPGADDLTAKVDSLTDITAIYNQSLWEIPMTDNPDNLWIYEAANEAPGMHAGFITMPNGIGGGGAFCYIAGRSYRWHNDNLRSNFEVILRYYLGMGQTGIEDQEAILPDEYILYQNYPNPFNPATTIRFGLPQKSDVRLEIFDILGRQVAILGDEPMEAGYHEIVWDSRNRSGGEVSSGVYFYRLKAGEFNSIKKMLILK